MKKLFGKLPTGEEVYLYTLRDGESVASVTDFGAILVSFAPYGLEITGGYDTLDGYLADNSHQGGSVGRFANRIGDARFVMDGKEYTLPDNAGGCCLHGGRGFDRRMWTVTELTENKITLAYTSKDGEEGFPGEVDVTATYLLTKEAIRIEYHAYPKAKTPISMTNHAYFNLDGIGGDVLDHTVWIDADEYTYLDSRLVATSGRIPLRGTKLDFIKPHTIGAYLDDELPGYDFNYVLNKTRVRDFDGTPLHLAATAENGSLRLSVYTNQDGVQFYTGNSLASEQNFRGNVKRIRHGAFCLEAQSEPNGPNRGEAFYNAGEVYSNITVYTVERK